MRGWALAKKSLTRSLEEYLEAIYTIKMSGKTPRVKAIAKAMGVKLSSVTDAVQRLSHLGFLNYERYGDVRLTERGEVVARKVYEREALLYKFLKDILKISEDVALKDACRIEHDLSKETVNNLAKFVEFVEKELSDDLKRKIASYLSSEREETL